ncbi:MAG: DUF4271 domain-containing protein [Dysgonamonadaceae bacterium]|nr:DUF4271 domain-containing protein [Dysgonamonadaceae bacterium]
MLTESLFFLVFLSLFLLFSLVFRKEGFGIIADLKGYFLPRNKNATGYSDQVTSAKVRSDAFFILQAAVIISVTAFIFSLKEDWWQLSFEINALVFIGIFVIILTFFGLKYLMYKIIGMFFLRDEINDWIAHYFGIVKMLGALLFIPVILYIYLGELRGIIYISTIIIFFISRVVIIAKLLNIFVKNKIGLFYFFVYLCGTEIAPYILYFKGVFLLTSIVGNIIL